FFFVLQLLLDQEELKKLLVSATRPAVQELLKKELRRVDREASSRAQQSKAADASPKAAAAGPPSTTKLSNYGWDQSEKFLKVYVSLEGVQKAPSENVSVEFKER
uniref:Calcyclin binding protein n=1 Tax=Petromyzon marinus TaxID=7757 RepID=S4RX11_PETMA